MTESHDRLYRQAFLSNTAVAAAVKRTRGTLQKNDGGRSFLVYDEYSLIIERMPPGVTPEAFLIEFGTHLNRTVDDPMDIDMFGPDNGSVILSGLEPNYFIYTVLNDHYGGEHPEYGSREFGFERQHNDGTIKIYTRAVSSPADMLADHVGKHLQEGGWTAMIRGMGRTITCRGGVAAQGSFKTSKWSVPKSR